MLDTGATPTHVQYGHDMYQILGRVRIKNLFFVAHTLDYLSRPLLDYSPLEYLYHYRKLFIKK